MGAPQLPIQWTPELEDFALKRRNAAFWHTLKFCVEKSRYQWPTDRRVEILNVGCGKAEETPTLASFFSTGIFDCPDDRAHVTGIDADPHSLDIARNHSSFVNVYENHNVISVKASASFFPADATRLSATPQLAGRQFDVILIRHHYASLNQLAESRETWQKIFAECLGKLTSDGILLITSYSDAEHRLALELLANAPGEIRFEGSNPQAFKIVSPTHKNVANDKCVVILKRR